MTIDHARRADLYKAALENVRDWLTDYEVMIGRTPALDLHIILADALAEDAQGLNDSPAREHKPVVVVYWEWGPGPHEGARFWGAHNVTNDGRIRDWPAQGLKPLGAAKVSVAIGEGLELIETAAAPAATL